MSAVRTATTGACRSISRVRWAQVTRMRVTLLPLLLILLAACGTNATTVTPRPTSTPTQVVPTATTRPPARLGARGAGINSEPGYRPWRYLAGPAPEGWWCVQPNCAPNVDPQIRIDTDLALASELGVNMIRLDFLWRFIEPQRGIYDWSRADLIVREAQRYGVQLQPILMWTPSWVGYPNDPPSSQDFKAFATALVSRYHSSIHYWELWSEPDISKYWNANEQAYVQDILIPGYQGVKAADNTALVILGGPSWSNGDWYNRLYEYGGGNSFDIVSWHSYGDITTVLLSARTAHQIMAYHHQSQKPLWLGEFGAQDWTTTGSAQVTLLTGVLNSNSPIAQADWYTLRDEDAMTCCPPAISVSANWGLVKRDGSARKAGFYALQNLISAGLPLVDTSHG